MGAHGARRLPTSSEARGEVSAWDAARSAAEALAPADRWRQALADRLHAAAGGHHVAVCTCPLGRPERGRFAVSPAGSRELEARTASEYLSQLQRSGEGWPRLYQRHGVVFPVVEARRGLPLATALRDGQLAAEGVRGYVCALFVTAHGELVGWIEIGTTKPERRVLAEIADPLRDVARSATRTLEVTLDLARSCGAVFPAPAPADDALSAREREIVTLVAEGLSDLNIATRLSICESTVGSHLRRVYRKLGVHSRVELLRRAERAHVG